MGKCFLTQTFLIIQVIVLDLKFPNLQAKTALQYHMKTNQMRPVAKRDNSCTLEAPDLAILEFEI